MAISTLEPTEFPEHNFPFELIHNRKPADAIGQVVLCAGGHHPKCRLVSMKYMVVVYTGAADVFVAEDGTGNNATQDLTGGAAIGVETTCTLIQGQVFERNEGICINMTTDGDNANAGILTLQLESIH